MDQMGVSDGNRMISRMLCHKPSQLKKVAEQLISHCNQRRNCVVEMEHCEITMKRRNKCFVLSITSHEAKWELTTLGAPDKTFMLWSASVLLNLNRKRSLYDPSQPTKRNENKKGQ